jgi:uncharacterized protein
VVVLEGPRAAGKTRLAELIVGRERLFRLDDPGTRSAAEQSLRAWIEQLPVGSAIDEAQLIPGISVEAKRIADDANSQPGRLLLTGSHRLSRTELGGSDPLAGRAKRFTLLPFTQSELAGEPRDVISALFNEGPSTWSAPAITQQEMRSRIVRGGFPGVQNFEERDLSDWQQTYATSVVGDTTTGRDVERLARLFRWIAASSGLKQNILSFSDANDLNRKTVSEYLNLLRQLFLIFDVPNLATGAKQQELPTHLFVVDPIFTAAALKLTEQSGAATSEEGRAFETFVACELSRLLGASHTSATLHWWKRVSPKPKVEVDLILKRADNRLVAFEVKASREFISQDFAGLRRLRDEFPDQFHRGFVIHCGDNIVRLEENLWAVPFSLLWSIGDLLADPRSRAIPRSVDLFDAVRGLQTTRTVTPPLVDEYSNEMFNQLQDAIGALLAGLRFERSSGRTESESEAILRIGLPGKKECEFRLLLRTINERPQWTFRWTKSDGSSGGSWDHLVDSFTNRPGHQEAMLEFLHQIATLLQSVLDDLVNSREKPSSERAILRAAGIVRDSRGYER